MELEFRPCPDCGWSLPANATRCPNCAPLARYDQPAAAKAAPPAPERSEALTSEQYAALFIPNALIVLAGFALALAIILRLRFLILERALLTLPLLALIIGGALVAAIAAAPFAFVWRRRSDLFPPLARVYRLPLANTGFRPGGRRNGRYVPPSYHFEFAGLGSFSVSEELYRQAELEAIYEIVISPRHQRLWQAAKL